MVLDIAPPTGALQPWKWQLTGIGYSTAAQGQPTVQTGEGR